MQGEVESHLFKEEHCECPVETEQTFFTGFKMLLQEAHSLAVVHGTGGESSVHKTGELLRLQSKVLAPSSVAFQRKHWMSSPALR